MPITFYCRAYLFRARRNGEDRLGLDAVVKGVSCNRGGAGHILIGGICAGTDEADLELFGPLVVNDCLLELADGRSQVGSEGTIDVGLELGKVDLDELIILAALIRLKFLCIAARQVADSLALCRREVVVGAVVEGEERGCCADLSSLKRS